MQISFFSFSLTGARHIIGARAPAVSSMRAAGWLTSFLPPPPQPRERASLPPSHQNRFLVHVNTRYWGF